MMKLMIRITALVITCLSAARIVAAGGWSVMTLDEVLQRVVVSEPLEIGFAIRPHGRTLVNGIEASVVLEHADNGKILRFNATNDGNGHYLARVRFPEPSIWRLSLDGYGWHPMPEIEVLAEQAKRDPPLRRTEVGKSLFVGKGCSTCHANGRIAGVRTTVQQAPDLTQYRNSPEFLRQWLDDPATVRADATMPDLDLKPQEIDLLIAFLNDHSRTVGLE